MATRLASTSVTARLLGLRGRIIVTAKSRHFVVDAPLVMGGPNEELSPLDLFLASIASETLFVCEKVAQQMRLPLSSIAVNASGDYDPLGVIGEPVDPGFKSLRIRILVEGIAEPQAETMIEAYKKRCPIYTTLIRAIPIEVETVFNRG
ncbi:MAG: OsmC family protein [Anaerolineae bacterium]|nr:OsmC family protein [Anaerolineae bacterium]